MVDPLSFDGSFPHDSYPLGLEALKEKVTAECLSLILFHHLYTINYDERFLRQKIKNTNLNLVAYP